MFNFNYDLTFFLIYFQSFELSSRKRTYSSCKAVIVFLG